MLKYDVDELMLRDVQLMWSVRNRKPRTGLTEQCIVLINRINRTEIYLLNTRWGWQRNACSNRANEWIFPDVAEQQKKRMWLCAHIKADCPITYMCTHMQREAPNRKLRDHLWWQWFAFAHLRRPRIASDRACVCVCKRFVSAATERILLFRLCWAHTLVSISKLQYLSGQPSVEICHTTRLIIALVARRTLYDNHLQPRMQPINKQNKIWKHILWIFSYYITIMQMGALASFICIVCIHLKKEWRVNLLLF